MSTLRDLLFTIETDHSLYHNMCHIFCSAPGDRKTQLDTDHQLSHVYLLITVILLCIENKLFYSFHNDNSYIQPYMNETKIFIFISFAMFLENVIFVYKMLSLMWPT